ncbi:MAG: hypothetical protein HDR38_05050 [Treponema sp.]|nr:hypothetical protein [Treponema sp.]
MPAGISRWNCSEAATDFTSCNARRIIKLLTFFQIGKEIRTKKRKNLQKKDCRRQKLPLAATQTLTVLWANSHWVLNKKSLTFTQKLTEFLKILTDFLKKLTDFF